MNVWTPTSYEQTSKVTQLSYFLSLDNPRSSCETATNNAWWRFELALMSIQLCPSIFHQPQKHIRRYK